MEIQTQPPLDLEPHQFRALAILPSISGFVSFCASIWIVVEVITTRAKLVTVYNRLLLGMSISSALSSIGHMFGPLPTPSLFDDEAAWAKGNDSTCDAQGFLVQLGIVAPIYHVSLSVYYLLLVRFEMTQDKIKKFAEPMMHTTAILIGVGTGAAAIALDLFTGSALWCWITPFPTYYRVWFFFVPLWLSMVSVLGINVWIYRTVRRREQRAAKLHAIHHEKHGRGRLGENYTGTNITSVILPKGKKFSSESSLMMSSSSNLSSSSRRTISSKRTNSEKPRVSFTFGHPPARIFYSADFANASHRSLNAIEEDVECDELSAGESQRRVEKKEEVRKGSLAVSDLPLSQIDDQQSTPDAKTKSVEKCHAGEPDLTPQKNEGRQSKAGIRFSMLKDMFTPQAEQEPSFMFKKDDDQELPLNKEENSFFNPIIPIQRMILPERCARRFSQKIQKRQDTTEKSMNSVRTVDVKFVVATVEDYPSAAKQYAATYHIGARIILYQSIAFVVGFWTIWIFPTIRQLVLLEDPTDIYGLLCLEAFFEPLQGFFNFFVYRFSHFVRLKELHPQWSTLKLLRHTMRWTFLTNRSNAVKARKKSDSGLSPKGDVISSLLVDESGEMISDHDSDSDPDDSGEILPIKDNTSGMLSVRVPSERIMKRMSSLMGDLMTEFADYPDTLNDDYMEVVGQDLFSYPTSMFPTVYSKQSFSEIPNTSPAAFPMPHFPVGQTSVYADEYFSGHNGSEKLDKQDTGTLNTQKDLSKENDLDANGDQPANNGTSKSEDGIKVQQHEQDKIDNNKN